MTNNLKQWKQGVALVLVSVGVLSGAACATTSYGYPSSPSNRPVPGAPSNARLAQQNGYDRGVRAGQQDGRGGRPFRYDNDSEYRSGTWGYRSNYGRRADYQQNFRRGYELGYREGYQQWSRQGAQPRPGRGGSYDPAYDRGYEDGVSAGQRAVRARKPYDPIIEMRYREGDRGYNRQYGAEEVYKRQYRQGFRDGYDRGCGRR